MTTTKDYASARLANIKVSEILRIGARAAQLRRAGQDIIVLAAGEPDFDTPAPVRSAAVNAIQQGLTKYTQLEGTPELRAAITRKLMRDNALEYTSDEIIVSSGAKQVIFNALAATLEPGDEVILPAPFWTSYSDMVLINGGAPKIVSCGEAQHFKLDAAALERAISSRTRWVILNSPSNPTGAAYRKTEMLALLEVLERHPRIMLLSDEIYEHILYDSLIHVSPAALVPGLRDRILTASGVSKSYAMTGWRIGWGAGPRGLIEAMAVVQSQVTSCASSIGQAAALAALDGPQNIVAERRTVLQERRNRLVAALNRIAGIRCTTPDGAFYVFPSLIGLIGSRTPSGECLTTDRRVIEYFLEQGRVAVVPGSAFGMPGYFRISYAASLENLREGCARLARAVDCLVLPDQPRVPAWELG